MEWGMMMMMMRRWALSSHPGYAWHSYGMGVGVRKSRGGGERSGNGGKGLMSLCRRRYRGGNSEKGCGGGGLSREAQARG